MSAAMQSLPAPSPPAPTGWAHDALMKLGPRLAFDVAAQLRPLHETLARYGISQPQYTQMEATPWFQGMLTDARAKWASELGAVERIRLKALVALEESLDVPFSIAHDGDAAPNARLEAVKTMERIAGVVPPTAGGVGAGESGPRFAITIDLGGGKTVGVNFQPGGTSTDASGDDQLVDGTAEEVRDPTSVVNLALQNGAQGAPEGGGEISEMEGEPAGLLEPAPDGWMYPGALGAPEPAQVGGED